MLCCKGNYEFPFQCPIPVGLPGSMRLTGSSNCNITYAVDACLHRPGSLSWDVKGSADFLVSAAPAPAQSAPLYMDPQFVDVRSCFCIGRGRMLTGGSAASSILAAGEEFRVNYAAQNESTAKINAIEIKLLELVTWRASGHSARAGAATFERVLSARPGNNQTQIEDLYLLPTKKDGDKQVRTVIQDVCVCVCVCVYVCVVLYV
jgi:hypothetical protein